MMGQLENARTQLTNERKECNDKRRLVEEAERELLNAKSQMHITEMENYRIKENGSKLKVRRKRLSRCSGAESWLQVVSAVKDPDSFSVSLFLFFFSSALKSLRRTPLKKLQRLQR